MASQTEKAALINQLLNLLGPEGVETGPEALAYFAEDALRGRGAEEAVSAPLAITRPGTAQETATLLRFASENSLPVVPYGAGTGLMGGARTYKPGVVLDTIRLNAIDPQPADRLVWAGSGAILQDVDSRLTPLGLCLGHDPWTFPVATVGGTLSTNSLGYRGGRYGGMADNALALEVALADGTLFRTRAVRRHSAGPNLARLFIGAEGTLGVITAAALQAYPVPEAQDLRAFNFDSFEAGFAAVDAIAALGLRPSLLDYGEGHASPWPLLVPRENEPPLLYLGFEGLREEVAFSIDRAIPIIKTNQGQELPREQAQSFWQRRHVVAQRFARGKPRDDQPRNPGVAYDYMHVSLPPSQVLKFREHCHAVTFRNEVALLECGLWTAPDFFSAVFALPEELGGHEILSGVIDTLLEACQDLGGSMEYVHGAGRRLAHLMPREHGEALDVLRRIKDALDSQGILNPDKLGL